MTSQQKVLRVGTAALLLAISLRLFSQGGSPFFAHYKENPQLFSFLVYLQTGRVVRYPDFPEPQTPQAPDPNTGTTIFPEDSGNPMLPAFSAQDLQVLSLTYGCDYRPDLEPLLLSPLSWDLCTDAPTVLIVHTHATESYERSPQEFYEENAPYRTLDTRYNMISIGEELTRVLEAGGIHVIHDKTLHDYPSYNDAYSHTRASIAKYLEQYPSIRMVLDLHRDASDGENGNQLTTSATVGGQASSQLMLVVGTDASGNYHPNWQENLSLALKLTAMLEQKSPGITRPINLRAQRFNMDMTPASLLVEVGGAGDSHPQAILAANALGQSILALAKGTASSQ